MNKTAESTKVFKMFSLKKEVLVSRGLAAAIVLALSGVAVAADINETSTASPTQTLTFDNNGVAVVGDSTSGDNPTLAVFDTATGYGAELSASQNQLLISGPGGTTNIATDSSNIAGNLSVEKGLAVTGVSLAPGQAALDVTGDSKLTGALSVTGATTLNSSGTNQISADATSARMVSGSNSLTVNAAGVSAAFSDSGISSSITMGNGTSGVAINATGASNTAAVASLTTTNTDTSITHGLSVYTTATTLSGGESASTTLTLTDGGLAVSTAAGNTFTVTSAGAAQIGNDGMAGSLVISKGDGTSAKSVVLDGVANSITGTTNSIVGSTSTTVTGNSTSLTLDSAGATLNNVQLHGVANGVAGTDAVNVNQLNAVVGKTNALNHRIDEVADRSYSGIASVAALAGIPAPAAGKRYTVGAAVGTYGGKSALAVGFRGALSDSVAVTAGISQNSDSRAAANLGFGYSW